MLQRLSRSIRVLTAVCFLATNAKADIAVNANVTYQTMIGWAGATQTAQSSPSYPLFRDALFDRFITELGLTRASIGIISSVENTRDFQLEFMNGQLTKQQYRCLSYSTVNDNNDASSINPAGFTWGPLDREVESVLVPLRQRATANGETLSINLVYVSFTDLISECPSLQLTNHHGNPQEYAEFMLATFQHMNSKYGFVPDSIELYLEPDLVNTPTKWTPSVLGQALSAAQARLSANGFNPKFVGPSTTSMANVVPYFNGMGTAAIQHLSEISYHRYQGVSPSTLEQINTLAVQHNKKTSMLELISANYDVLHDDIKVGRASSWQQFVLAYSECADVPMFPCGNYSNPPSPSDDDGSKYYLVDDSSPNYIIYMGERTKMLAQYMKYIRPGARRIQATQTDSSLDIDPVAFINPNGRYVVVMKAHRGNTPQNITGLPAGTYGRNYRTIFGTLVNLSDVTITAGQALAFPGLTDWGVATVYGKTGGAPPPNPCDVNNDGTVNNQDVQSCIDQAKGLVSCGSCRIDGNSICNVIDVQRVANAIGGNCVSP